MQKLKPTSALKSSFFPFAEDTATETKSPIPGSLSMVADGASFDRLSWLGFVDRPACWGFSWTVGPADSVSTSLSSTSDPIKAWLSVDSRALLCKRKIQIWYLKVWKVLKRRILNSNGNSWCVVELCMILKRTFLTKIGKL